MEQTQEAGYIFDFQSHGQCDPGGKVMPPVSDVEAHNAALDRQLIEQMRSAKDGEKFVLYVTTVSMTDADGNPVRRQSGYHTYSPTAYCRVHTWAGTWERQTTRFRYSYHNIAGFMGRLDVWFTGPDGLPWHGVNIGYNQILRCYRLKQKGNK
jgi:hypothetical protein